MTGPFEEGQWYRAKFGSYWHIVTSTYGATACSRRLSPEAAKVDGRSGIECPKCYATLPPEPDVDPTPEPEPDIDIWEVLA